MQCVLPVPLRPRTMAGELDSSTAARSFVVNRREGLHFSGGDPWAIFSSTSIRQLQSFMGLFFPG